MVEVCVVGGGTSGCEAAAEASARGAEVTVVEREEGADVPWKSWPDLIQGRKHGVKRDGRRPLGSRSPKVLLAEAVRSGPGYVETKAGRVNSDFVVLATGSSFEPPGFQGFRRPGVLTLDSRPSYEELGRTSDSTSRVVVAGEGVRSLEVADRLSAKGLRVKVFVSSWQSRPPSPLVAEVLYDKARRSGVTVVPGSVTRALGEARLEAVLADGTVTPCDTLVFVPRRFPRIVPSQALVGSTGGVLVDQNLRTGDPRTYAAGGCAELAGSSLPCTFVQEPSLSGRVAASNCLGDGIRLVPARSSEAVLFGLRWA